MGLAVSTALKHIWNDKLKLRLYPNTPIGLSGETPTAVIRSDVTCHSSDSVTHNRRGHLPKAAAHAGACRLLIPHVIRASGRIDAERLLYCAWPSRRLLCLSRVADIDAATATQHISGAIKCPSVHGNSMASETPSMQSSCSAPRPVCSLVHSNVWIDACATDNRQDALLALTRSRIRAVSQGRCRCAAAMHTIAAHTCPRRQQVMSQLAAVGSSCSPDVWTPGRYGGRAISSGRSEGGSPEPSSPPGSVVGRTIATDRHEAIAGPGSEARTMHITARGTPLPAPFVLQFYKQTNDSLSVRMHSQSTRTLVGAVVRAQDLHGFHASMLLACSGTLVSLAECRRPGHTGPECSADELLDG